MNMDKSAVVSWRASALAEPVLTAPPCLFVYGGLDVTASKQPFSARSSSGISSWTASTFWSVSFPHAHSGFPFCTIPSSRPLSLPEKSSTRFLRQAARTSATSACQSFILPSRPFSRTDSSARQTFAFWNSMPCRAGICVLCDRINGTIPFPVPRSIRRSGHFPVRCRISAVNPARRTASTP